MSKVKLFAAIMLALAVCLGGTAALADEDGFEAVAGEWYTEEYSMNITEDGRFLIAFNDEDWTGALEETDWVNEEDEELTAYRLILDDPGLSLWEDIALVPDLYHPGKLTFWHDGTEGEAFYNVPVYIREVPEDEEELAYYEPYFTVDTADGEEPAARMMITFLRPVTNVAMFTMFDQEIDEEGNLGYNADAFEWWDALDSQERILVIHVFEGDMPELGINFVTEEDEMLDFAIEISGADGEPVLTLLPPSNG